MPPQRTIHIDRSHMLQTIARRSSEHVADVAAERADWETNRYGRILTGATTYWWDFFGDGWVARDLPMLAGKPLSASERIRAQQAIREMEAAGLIELLPRWVRLTNAGRLRVAELEAAVDA